MNSEQIKILFVCTYRGGRSQVAKALMDRHGEDFVESHHACFDSEPISLSFVDLLSAHDIPINQRSPSVFDSKIRATDFDFVVCLCSSGGSEMSSLFREHIEKIFPKCPEQFHWDIKDFSTCGDAEEGFEQCVISNCEVIEQEVRNLLKIAKVKFKKHEI